MGCINRAIAYAIVREPPETMDEISLYLYSAQTTYDEITQRPAPKSRWRENIAAKVAARKAELEALTGHILNVSNGVKGKTPPLVRTLLRRERAAKWDLNELRRVRAEREELILVYQKKLSTHESRCQRRRENNLFEFNRRSFYRRLHGETKEGTQQKAEMLDTWGSMWKARPRKGVSFPFCGPDAPLMTESCGVPDIRKKFDEAVTRLSDWKTPGVDKVYNFFIKNCKPIHDCMCRAIEQFTLDPGSIPEWLCTGVTYLIPKVDNPSAPTDYRPITCMPNLYKLMTKVVATEVRNFVEVNGILSENQLGTRRDCQGAKEQALINKCLARAHGNSLVSMWVDVKKAYDSVDHAYLVECLRRLKLPMWFIKFVATVMDRWNVHLNYNKCDIGEVKLERGILQGDSMSPLLFVLCLEPLSRVLTAQFEQMSIEHEGGCFSTNHLMFIDDIKLFARSSEILHSMGKVLKGFMKAVGLELNYDKSATNTPVCGDLVKVLEEHQGYKYLGVVESPASLITPETRKCVVEGVRSRAAMLCKTRLNARNLFHALNEYAISLLNYYVGLIEFEPSEYDEMDLIVRRVLRENHVHVLASNKERLYLSRGQLGRGLSNIVHLSERILTKMHDTLWSGSSVSQRKAAILAAEKARGTHLGTIKGYVSAKYGLGATQVNVKELIKLQKESLIKKINLKVLHKTLFSSLDNPHIDVSSSSTWLKYGNNSPRSEGLFSYLQDRNFFNGQRKQCNHCKSKAMTVDHLATKCGSMLYHDYTWRHNEVVHGIVFQYPHPFNSTHLNILGS
ncbi:uncharacterized protein LOC115230004 [Octopus sinensis]|uniref:Uncharacterized protein LOC115230004 n=1 Tax=Octopus sinensis TaxID=2607531 RepID=A0A6P7TWJ5_9MOLL|nr:uncharacterized protein LOC115230004 [Octopus sinensis]